MRIGVEGAVDAGVLSDNPGDVATTMAAVAKTSLLILVVVGSVSSAPVSMSNACSGSIISELELEAPPMTNFDGGTGNPMESARAACKSSSSFSAQLATRRAALVLLSMLVVSIALLSLLLLFSWNISLVTSIGLPSISGEGDGVACESSDVDKGLVEPEAVDLLLLLLSKKVVVVCVGGGFISPVSTTELFVVDVDVDVAFDAVAVDAAESFIDEDDRGGSLSCDFPRVGSLLFPPPPNLDSRWSRSCCGVSSFFCLAFAPPSSSIDRSPPPPGNISDEEGLLLMAAKSYLKKVVVGMV